MEFISGGQVKVYIYCTVFIVKICSDSNLFIIKIYICIFTFTFISYSDTYLFPRGRHIDGVFKHGPGSGGGGSRRLPLGLPSSPNLGLSR
jgi:hypothetical protein